MTKEEAYDLYYLMKSPAKVSFCYSDSPYKIYVKALEEDGNCIIRSENKRSENKWYKSIHDYLQKANISDTLRLASICDQLHDFKVLSK